MINERPQSSDCRVTVISIWHDRRARVEDSLRSVLSQTSTSAKYLIVDDGSTDGTFEALSTVAADFPRQDVSVIQQRNEGFTKALKRWTSEVETPYFALHGAGDISAPTRIASQIDHAESTQAVVVGCAVGSVDAAGLRSSVERMPRDCRRGGAVPRRPPRPGTHGAALIRTEVFNAAGGYRTVFRYSQDADLWFRMSALGDFQGVPDLLYWKYGGTGETVSSDASKRLLQALYGELARQCEEDRVAGRPDLVQRFDEDAIHFMRDTGRLRKRLLGSGVQAQDLAVMRGLVGTEMAQGGGATMRSRSPRLAALRRLLP